MQKCMQGYVQVYQHHRSVFSGMFSTVLEGTLELDVAGLKGAGVSLYTDSSSSSEEAEVEAGPRPAIKPWVGFGCGCVAMTVWEADVSPCWT